MQLIASMIPLVICCGAATHDLWWLHAAVIASILVLAGILPAAKRIESIFVFALTAVSTFPLNIRFVLKTMEFVTTDSTHLVLLLCWATVLFGIFLNIEEIFMLIISQRLWPRQRHIFTKNERRD